MVLLTKIQEAAIVENLKKRYMDDLIYVSFSILPVNKTFVTKLIITIMIIIIIYNKIVYFLGHLFRILAF